MGYAFWSAFLCDDSNVARAVLQGGKQLTFIPSTPLRYNFFHLQEKVFRPRSGLKVNSIGVGSIMGHTWSKGTAGTTVFVRGGNVRDMRLGYLEVAGYCLDEANSRLTGLINREALAS